MIQKRTKIVCTLGPASDSLEMIRSLFRAGMNVARLNFSHGNHDYFSKLVATIRQVAQEENGLITILQDLQGPKIRVGDLGEAGVELKVGAEVIFSTKVGVGRPQIFVAYDKLHQDVKPGDRMLFDDGLLEVEVTGVVGSEVTAKVLVGGILKSHKGLNIPTASIQAPSLTEKDKDDLKFGLSLKVDFVALSFVRSANDILELRQLLESAPATKIIAKIEKHEAVKNFASILEVADGIMVARGDLGVEIPMEDVPVVQKEIIGLALAAAKPVIVATQMLDSMIRNPRPTRAEVSDVANAVIDHADAVMLSGETASGAYPLEVVTVMSKIIEETEASVYDDLPLAKRRHNLDSDHLLAEVVKLLDAANQTKLVLVVSQSATVARLVSSLRPEMSIFVPTTNLQNLQQLNLSWGVQPLFLNEMSSFNQVISSSLELLQAEGLVQFKDKIFIVGNTNLDSTDKINITEFREI